MPTWTLRSAHERDIAIQAGRARLEGSLAIPDGARGVVLFAHGSGSSRHSPRNRFVAATLQRAGLATLLMDLLSPEEERVDQHTRQLRFDIPLLAGRLEQAGDWLAGQPETAPLTLGLFGASTGAAASLVAAASRPERVAAVVSRGGRPDLAGDSLLRVRSPTLLLVGEDDAPVIALNRQAMMSMTSIPESELRLVIVPGATHLFEEPGALELVAQHAVDWFERRLLAS